MENSETGLCQQKGYSNSDSHSVHLQRAKKRLRMHNTLNVDADAVTTVEDHVRFLFCEPKTESWLTEGQKYVAWSVKAISTEAHRWQNQNWQHGSIDLICLVVTVQGGGGKVMNQSGLLEYCF